MKFSPLCLILLIISCLEGNAAKLEAKCLETLKKAAVCPDFWVQVHAIEYLAELGFTDVAGQLISSELAGYENVPQKRIGLWRSKYKISQNDEEKGEWLNKIKHAYLDSLGHDRVHAAETLAKLGFSLNNLENKTVSSDLKNSGILASYVRWGTSLPKMNSNDYVAHHLLVKELNSNDVNRKKVAAYGLGYIGQLPRENWRFLAFSALKEPTGSAAYPYMLGAAYSIYDPEETDSQYLVERIYKKLKLLKNLNDRESRVELCRALAVNGGKDDISLLVDLLYGKSPITQLVPLKSGLDPEDHPWNLDVRAAAAYALLKIINKS